MSATRVFTCSLALLFAVFAAAVHPMRASAQQMEDVVYLKDGSIIRGIIVEQRPGESILIKTKDGNQFRYLMTQIDRITKESSPSTSDVSGQKAPGRHGLWFNIGVGAGSLGCSDCTDRSNGFSGGLALGGTISRNVLLGAFSNGWVHSEGGATATASVLVLGVRIYPSATGGLFFLGGVGVSSVGVNVSGYGSVSETGTGVLLGLGWDLRIARSLNLTPFWNGVGISSSSGDANFGQLGIGITLHQ